MFCFIIILFHIDLHLNSFQLSGIGIAGSLGTMYPLFMELTPSTHRHVLFCIHPVMGALAGILLYLTGWQTIPLFGWRVVVALGAIPSFIAIILVATFLPRSPRHLLLIGEKVAAERILKDMAIKNGRPLDSIQFELDALKPEECEEFGFGVVFAKKHLRITFSLLFTWLSIGFLHYGTVLLGTVLPDIYREICNFGHRDRFVDKSCGCLVGPPVHVVPLIGGALGEIGSLVFPWLLANFIGRRLTFCIGGALAACISGLHIICKGDALLAVSLFFNRAVTLGLFLTAIRYTSEVYPTSARAVALGLGSSANRIGNLIAPFVAQVVVEDVSLVIAMVIFAVVGVILMLLSFVGLHIETKDRPLFDTFAELEASMEEPGKSTITTSYQTFPKELEKKVH